jgi:sugar O-acyltransferase (sialic acid O-acetyltransferase NeuD family)
MTQKNTIIIGASGHARVCLDILLLVGKKVIGFADDDLSLKGMLLNGYPILGEVGEVISKFDKKNIDFFIAIGNNDDRNNLVNYLKENEIHCEINIIHPSAIISPQVSMGVGNFIAPGVIINTDTRIGNYTIINTAATLDHDNLIKDFAQISPGCNLAGHITVEEHAFLGTGVVVIPSKTIGTQSVIGAGAVVITDIPPNSTALGVPARVIKIRKDK